MKNEARRAAKRKRDEEAGDMEEGEILDTEESGQAEDSQEETQGEEGPPPSAEPVQKKKKIEGTSMHVKDMTKEERQRRVEELKEQRREKVL